MSLKMAKKETLPFQSRGLIVSERKRNLQARQAKLERFWLNPPEKTGLEHHRINLTADFTLSFLEEGMKIVDLGCGSGDLLSKIASNQWQITAVDGATNALKKIKEKNLCQVTTEIALLPSTHLPDQSYDVVLCNDLFAELEGGERRLMVSELTRLVTPDGIIIVTNPLNTRTENPAEHLIGLLSTELSIETVGCSYSGLQARYFPRAKKFYSMIESIGSLSPERNRDFILIQAKKKPLY